MQLFFLLIRIWFVTRFTSISIFIFLLFIFLKYCLQYLILFIFNYFLILFFNRLRIYFLKWRFSRIIFINRKRVIMEKKAVFIFWKSIESFTQKPYICRLKRTVSCIFPYWWHSSKAASKRSWMLNSIISVSKWNDCSKTSIEWLLLHLIYQIISWLRIKIKFLFIQHFCKLRLIQIFLIFCWLSQSMVVTHFNSSIFIQLRFPTSLHHYSLRVLLVHWLLLLKKVQQTILIRSILLIVVLYLTVYDTIDILII